jgi:uncharacterized membrane protein YeaQ/YmgE (transglycosylase-associated protein family)
MPNPSFVFGFILSTLIGSGFHLVFGGDARRLALFLLSGWLGFAIGHGMGVIFDVDSFKVGSLHLLTALTGAVVALTVARIMTSRRLRRRSTRKG